MAIVEEEKGSKSARKVPADKMTENLERAKQDLSNAKGGIKALVSFLHTMCE